MKRKLAGVLSAIILAMQFNTLSVLAMEKIEDKATRESSTKPLENNETIDNIGENLDSEVENDEVVIEESNKGENEEEEIEKNAEIESDDKVNEQPLEEKQLDKEKISEEKFRNSTYEVIKKPLQVNYSSDTEMKEEMKMDFQALSELKYLVPKTENNYEVVEAHKNGSYSYLDSSNELNKAIVKADRLNKEGKTKNESLTAVINNNGQIVYSPVAVAKIIKHVNGNPYPNRDKNTNFYSDANLTNAYTYINHGYVDDAAIIEDKGTVAKVQLSGYKGWLNKNTETDEFDMVVVPINQVTNPSYYKNVNGNLVHFISSDVTGKKESGHSISIGKAPSFMVENREYYSYDGAYFYNTLTDAINDLKENLNIRAVNSGNKFYSYYLNLPFRSRTTFTADEINNFLDKNTDGHSKLRGIGNALINAEQTYGVNALMILSIAINESNWGKSSIAQEKNNIFGINAIDANPGQAANSFETVEQCINEFARNYISRGYSDPADWRYRGGHLGNKNLGANVKYASDPFWGEKATKYMYQIDKTIAGASLRDFNAYALGFHKQETKIKDKNGNLLYDVKGGYPSKAGYFDTAVIINEFDSASGEYKINPHRTSNVNSGKFDGNYDWNNYGVIKPNEVNIINESKIKKSLNIKYNVYIEGKGWQEEKNNGEIAGTWGQAKRVEAIKINVDSFYNIRLKYRVHLEDIGWQDWKYTGEVAGLPGKGKKIEAIEITLDNESYGHDLEYRVHVQDYGWQNWRKSGEVAGTVGLSKRIEAIEIKAKQESIKEMITYETHIEEEGWQGWKKDGELSGTSGKAKRLEGIKIDLRNDELVKDIKYRVHVENYGWQDWKSNGEIAGTTGECKRLEAIEIKIDNLPSDYKLQYRVHVEDYGWQSWKNNGEVAGTTGEAKRLEAIEVRVVKA